MLVNEMIDKLKELQKPVSFTPQLSEKKKTGFLALLKRIPLFSGLLDGLSNTGSAIIQFVALAGHVTPALSHAAKGVQFLGIIVAAVDALRIPILYLAAIILGEPVPFKLSKNAQLAYSALLLALTIAAIAAPATMMIMGIVSSAIIFLVSAFALGKFFYDRQQHKKAVQELTVKIEKENQELEALKKEAQLLETELLNQEEGADLSDIENRIVALIPQWETKKQSLQNKHEKKAEHNQKLENKNWEARMDKGMALLFSSLLVVGAVVALFFPPIGFSIMSLVGIAGFTYLLARMVLPQLSNVCHGIRSRWSKKDNKADNTEDLQHKPNLNGSPVLLVKALGSSDSLPDSPNNSARLKNQDPWMQHTSPVVSFGSTATLCGQTVKHKRPMVRVEPQMQKNLVI